METEGPNARLKQYARCAGRSSASSAIRSRLMNPRQIFGWLAVLAVCLAPCEALAQSALSGDHLAIKRAAGHITIDGDLSDEGWRDATRIEKWYETQPGDNTEPPVKNVGYLTFDDRFFYAGFVFDDPNVSAMRAPYADRDNLGDGYADYGGVIIDSRNSGRTGTLFLVTPRNVQYDAVLDDSSGEDQSPDFFWDSATRITDARLDPRDANPVLVAALPAARPADVGHSPVSQLSRATGTISSSRRSCRAAATASSAARTC